MFNVHFWAGLLTVTELNIDTGEITERSCSDSFISCYSCFSEEWFEVRCTLSISRVSLLWVCVEAHGVPIEGNVGCGRRMRWVREILLPSSEIPAVLTHTDRSIDGLIMLILHALWDVIEMWWTGHSFFCEKGGQTVCAIALHLNVALTGDGAFLLSPPKTHSVWFISIFNYGDMGQCPEKSPSSCHTHINIQIHVLICHTRVHTHTIYFVLQMIKKKNYDWKLTKYDLNILMIFGNKKKNCAAYDCFCAPGSDMILHIVIIWCREQVLPSVFKEDEAKACEQYEGASWETWTLWRHRLPHSARKQSEEETVHTPSAGVEIFRSAGWIWTHTWWE